MTSSGDNVGRMRRILLGGGLALGLGCGGPTATQVESKQPPRTPSGTLCADLPVVPANTPVDRPYHRVGPIATPLHEMTEAERLDWLRREACRLGGDAIIEAVNEDGKGSGSAWVLRSSGTVVVWTGKPPTP